jgi:hypothetical protein
MATFRQYSLYETEHKIKELLSDKTLRHDRDNIKPGQIFLARYTAVNKDQIFDKRPFVLLLKQNSSHLLGLNFHYLKMKLRVGTVNKIMKRNRMNIMNNLPMSFSYEDFKMLFKRPVFKNCIRRYRRQNMSTTVVKIPPSRYLEAARLNTALFTGGYSPENISKILSQQKRNQKNKSKFKK